MKSEKIEEIKKIRRNDLMDAFKLLHVSLPIVIALITFLASAGYIVYRMVSNYNYESRWKDYDECGLG